VKVFISILLTVAALAGSQCFAESATQSASPLTFQTWKDQQVLEAQNQVLRVSARLSLVKSGKADANPSTLKQPARLPSDKIRIADTEALSTAETDLKRAQDSLDAARGLQFEDYVDIYLPTLQGQPDVLQKLSDKLSKEELGQIFKELMHKSATADAKRNQALMEELTVTSRAKTP
jgi:hypothetical protein